MTAAVFSEDEEGLTIAVLPAAIYGQLKWVVPWR